MLKYIFSKRFLLHLVLAAILVSAAVGGAYVYLLNYTRQEAVVEVPDLLGYDLYEADIMLKDLSLESMVVDSLYLPEKRGGEIVDQQPSPDSRVKEKRKIYLTIARYKAPMVRIPDILDQTLALAMAKLESYDIGINELISKTSDCTDCVVGMQVNGKALEPGTLLEKGQSIDLFVGEGLTGKKVDIPSLYGLTVEEAQALLNMEGLNIGATPYVKCENAADSSAARIYKQNPAPSQSGKISKGSSVDVFLTSDLSEIPSVNLDSVKARLR